MTSAVIVEAVRTPVGRRNGALSQTHPVDLSAHVLSALAARSGIDPAIVDDVIWGCVGQVDEQAVDVARNAVLAADWPLTVAGVTIDRQCGSSQQALSFAVSSVVAGHADVAVAGGVESMSRVPMGATTRNGHPFTAGGWVARYGDLIPHQGHGAEMIAARYGFSRRQLDEFSADSHEKAKRAQASGAFSQEIAPVVVGDGLVAQDEGIRPGTSADSLAALKPAFRPDNGVIHAGNASQISDGAAALLVTTAELARTYGLTPLARIHTSVVVGSDPVEMLTGPIPATQKALARSGLSLQDIGAFEVNEAFAPVPMAWLQEIGADEDLLNPLGGAIALGHPLGASGARLATTLLHHMRANGIRFGLQTMCEGGGQANATIFELL